MIKVQEAAHDKVYIPATFQWATSKAHKDKKINCFLNFIYYNHSLELVSKELRKKETPIGAFNKFREINPEAK